MLRNENPSQKNAYHVTLRGSRKRILLIVGQYHNIFAPVAEPLYIAGLGCVLAGSTKVENTA